MTTVRLLTPAGRGAIAVVLAVGDTAAGMIDACFKSASGLSMADQPIDSIRYGVWRHDESAAGEELIVVRTAGDRFEIHCHGGVAAPSAILVSLERRGAVRETSAQAFHLREDALRLLPHATTERVAGVLLDQAGGSLESAIDEIASAIRSGDFEVAGERLDGLLQYGRMADRLVTPWRVVVAGPPNVGKSRLVNALVGYQRAIVFDQPGTTRDAVTALTAVNGWPVRLTDTAGLRATEDKIEAAGVALAQQVLQGADIVLSVIESSAFQDEPSDDLGWELSDNTVIIRVASKADLAPSNLELPDDVVSTSAVSQAGVDRLLVRIEHAIGVPPLEAGQGAPFRGWHVERLLEARDALQRGDPMKALAATEALLAPVRLD